MMRSGRWIPAWLVVLFVSPGLFAALVTAIPASKPDHASGNINRRLSGGRAAARQVYSPTIADDPYVVDQWEKSVETLERACRDRRQYCDQARSARRSVNR